MKQKGRGEEESDAQVEYGVRLGGIVKNRVGLGLGAAFVGDRVGSGVISN
jgi:hypothetical protein